MAFINYAIICVSKSGLEFSVSIMKLVSQHFVLLLFEKRTDLTPRTSDDFITDYENTVSWRGAADQEGFRKNNS